ncbi:MAG: hypothetical protein J7K13_04910 [Thermoplasmata archaeon]|nr:hypothetical protein [Thermoplasmata archaeon]
MKMTRRDVEKNRLYKEALYLHFIHLGYSPERALREVKRVIGGLACIY